MLFVSPFDRSGSILCSVHCNAITANIIITACSWCLGSDILICLLLRRHDRLGSRSKVERPSAPKSGNTGKLLCNKSCKRPKWSSFIPVRNSQISARDGWFANVFIYLSHSCFSPFSYTVCTAEPKGNTKLWHTLLSSCKGSHGCKMTWINQEYSHVWNIKKLTLEMTLDHCVPETFQVNLQVARESSFPKSLP